MINAKPGRGCPDVTHETRVSRTGSALRRNVDLQGGPVHADLGALTVAGGRLLHFHPAHSAVITNQTSPHFAETLGAVRVSALARGFLPARGRAVALR